MVISFSCLFEGIGSYFENVFIIASSLHENFLMGKRAVQFH